MGLSNDSTRWSPSLIKQKASGRNYLSAKIFTKIVLRNIFIDRKLHVKNKSVKGVIQQKKVMLKKAQFGLGKELRNFKIVFERFK